VYLFSLSHVQRFNFPRSVYGCDTVLDKNSGCTLYIDYQLDAPIIIYS